MKNMDPRRSAHTDTTIIIRTLARRMASGDLITSWMACLSALGPGGAGAVGMGIGVVGIGVVAITAEAATMAAVDIMVEAVTMGAAVITAEAVTDMRGVADLHAAEATAFAVTSGEDSTAEAEVAFTVAAVDSTVVEAVSTEAVAATPVGTGNRSERKA